MKWLLASPSPNLGRGLDSHRPLHKPWMQLALLASHLPFSLYHAVFWTQLDAKLRPGRSVGRDEIAEKDLHRIRTKVGSKGPRLIAGLLSLHSWIAIHRRYHGVCPG
jgi:hypothetical protein